MPYTSTGRDKGPIALDAASRLTHARAWRAGVFMLLALCFHAATSLAASAMWPVASGTELADLSLEQLADVIVTSVSRRRERLADAPASVYVITSEDIRRSRSTSIPEALRLAPNLDVARANVNQYAISARGFNNVLANKMLVLIDGRTVYTPLFSGVFWEAQGVMLEDIDRIEVISGPGATLWGANAVNGVINIITRPAKDTQGVLAFGQAGNLLAGTGARYGGDLGREGHYRIYAMYHDREASRFASGESVHDASIRGQAGFRADWERPGRSMTVQGDTYFGDIEQPTSTRTTQGANLLGRFARNFGDGRSFLVQAYYDYTERDHPQSFHENLSTADVEVQYGLQPRPDHKLLVGGGYRYAWDRVRNSAAQAFLPADRSMQWTHAFVQDDIALNERLTLTAGAKVETNVYTGAEFLPNLRLAWHAAPEQLVWGALTRAVRAPSRIDRDYNYPGTPPFLLESSPNFRSEVSNVAELGYRAQLTPDLSYSATGFYHYHQRLRSYEPVPEHPAWGNRARGETYGLETWATWRATPWWRINAGGVLLRQRLRLEAGSLDPGSGLATLGNDPSGWWSVRSRFDLTPRHELDVAVRHTASRPNPAVPAYTAVDARLGWNVLPHLQLSLIVQNALDPGHPEWGMETNRAEIQRSYFVKVLWRP
ncbi:MAG: TonB-dependent receptor [Pseudomonadota bacterium]|nr:TonB-dependent receptor [Pseudomonadota bacterium]